ncbi:LiaI-LiaF-like domain-containing protein [uncultured Draconibacterium sp.]|uniref:LiaF transmembrane domain-containing protein n=1 Tax=uncultured Draconibacterium sp. TaxID=1573823 RepID=UPI003216627A
MGHKADISNRRAVLGIFLIAIGALWILERLDLIPSFWNDILISWQMLLIGIGVFSIIGGNKTTGTILIVIGGFFLIPEVAHIPYELRRIGWPMLIIGVGVVLLVTQTGKHKKEPPHFEHGKSHGMDYFDDFVIFGGREVYVDSQNFFGGRSTSVFGGTEYDLRQARLSQNGAVIDCLAMFGGCGFKVPPDWTVKNEVTAIFGAFTDKRGTSLNQVVSDPSKTLVIKGFAAFGGVEVKYM